MFSLLYFWFVKAWFPGGSDGKASVRNVVPWFDPWDGKIPWRRKWPISPVLLPRKFHRWRSLVGYSPWDQKQSDTTKHSTRKSYSEIRTDKLAIHVAPQIISQTFWVEELSISFIENSITNKTNLWWQKLDQWLPGWKREVGWLQRDMRGLSRIMEIA